MVCRDVKFCVYTGQTIKTILAGVVFLSPNRQISRNYFPEKSKNRGKNSAILKFTARFITEFAMNQRFPNSLFLTISIKTKIPNTKLHSELFCRKQVRFFTLP